MWECNTKRVSAALGRGGSGSHGGTQQQGLSLVDMSLLQRGPHLQPLDLALELGEFWEEVALYDGLQLLAPLFLLEN